MSQQDEISKEKWKKWIQTFSFVYPKFLWKKKRKKKEERKIERKKRKKEREQSVQSKILKERKKGYNEERETEED